MSLAVWLLMIVLAVGCWALATGAAEASDGRYEGLVKVAEANYEVWLPPQSSPLAESILARMRESVAYLAPLFGVEAAETFTCLWLPKSAYPRFTKAEYGFPSNSRLGELLPAADVDLPVALTRLAPILDLENCEQAVLRRWAILLGLAEGSTAKEAVSHLSTSKGFYVRYGRDFILSHELAHQVNNRSRLPKRCPLLHETLAQWAAVEVARHSGRQADAELFTEFYRQLYRGGLSRVTQPRLSILTMLD